MSEWGLFETDDVVWDEFHESDDHIVPEPEDAQGNTWIVKGKRRKKLCRETLNVAAKSAVWKTLGNKNVLPEEKEAVLSSSISKEEPSDQLLDMDTWCDLQDEELANAYDPVHVDAGTGIEGGNDGVPEDCCKDVKLEPAENNLIIGICKEDPILEDGGATTVMNSCHFSLTDICPQEGDLEFFANAHEDKESRGLLDYGWDSIGDFEDVDRLLRNCEPTFGHSMNSSEDELLWPSSSSACADNSPPRIVQQVKPLSFPESRALKGKSEQYEVKMEFMPCDNPRPLSFDEKSNSKVEDCWQNDLILHTEKSSKYIQQSQGHAVNDSESSWEEHALEHSGRSEGTMGSRKEGTGTTSQHADKVNSYGKQIGSHKQPDEKHRKHLSDRKVARNIPPAISYSTGFQAQQFIPSKLHASTSSALQVFPSPVHASQKQLGESSSFRQVYPQVPYINAGYGYPLHHVPIMAPLSNLRSQAEQSQPVFVGYQLPADAPKQHQHMRKPFEIPLRPLNMTPQEKLEKLRRRQQMQARLAVEHQQQQLGGQNASMDHSLIHKQPHQIQCQHEAVNPKEGVNKILQTSSVESDSLTRENSSEVSGLTYDDNDSSLEATVLHQLQNVMSQLDIRTRLCIRDALYRLARSAMQRHCVGDTKSSSGSSGDQTEAGGMDASIRGDWSQSNRFIGMNDMETETNPIDRSIAHLLFHKRPVSSPGPVNVSVCSNDSILSTNPQCLTTAPNLWAYPPPVFESPTWLGVDPIEKMQVPIPVQSLTPIPKAGTGSSSQNVIKMKGSSSRGSCSASAAFLDPRVCGPLASVGLQINEGIMSVSKHQGVPQNNDAIKHNPLAEKGAIMDSCESLSSQSSCKNMHADQSAKDSKHFSPTVANSVKQESVERMQVDVSNVDSDVVMSEQFSEGTKKVI